VDSGRGVYRPVTTVTVLLIAFPVVGLATLSWAALLLPTDRLASVLHRPEQRMVGIRNGDGWQFIAAGLTVVGIVSTAVAVAASRLLRPGFRPRRPTA
jgi:hypothetical protein